MDNDYDLLFPENLIAKSQEQNPFVSLRDVTKEAVEDAIISLKFYPGEKINMAKIASSLGVSRTTVNDALTVLVKNGLVIRRAEINGYYVCDLSSAYLNNFFSARSVVEVSAAGMCARRAFLIDFSRLGKMIEEFTRCYEQNDIKGFTQIDQHFHQQIVELSGNSFIIDMYNDVLGRIRSLYSNMMIFSYKDVNMHTDGFYRITVFQHQTIVNGIRSGVPENAENAMRHHIDDCFQGFCRSTMSTYQPITKKLPVERD